MVEKNGDAESEQETGTQEDQELDHSNEFSTDDVPMYEEGDMLLAKVGSYPFWPCMVYRSPLSDGGGKCFKLKVTKGKCIHFYHVQYFGPMIERGWISTSSLLPYEGKDKFDEYVSKCIAEAGSKASKVRAYFSVSAFRAAVWEESWKDAAQAKDLGRLERIKACGRHYRDGGSDNESDSGDSQLSDDDSSSSSSPSPPKKRKRRRHSESSSDESESVKIENRPPKAVTKRKRTERKPKPIKPVHPKFPFEFMNLKFDAGHLGKLSACFKCADITPNDNNPYLLCAGSCGTMLHRDCMVLCPPMSKPMDEFSESHPATESDSGTVTLDSDSLILYKCEDCAGGITRCFICKGAGVPQDSCVLSKELLGGFRKKNSQACKALPVGDSHSLLRCGAKRCYQRYHPNCLLQTTFDTFYRLENDRILCPQHTCHSCVLDRSGNVKLTKRYSRCVLCPAAYHPGDWCIPAGSIELSPSHLICPKHLTDIYSPQFLAMLTRYRQQFSLLDPKNELSPLKALTNGHVNKRSSTALSKGTNGARQHQNDENEEDGVFSRYSSTISLSPYKAMNVKWCFICSEGGQLILCEQCPASFHKGCLKLKEVPSGSFICDQCHHGLYPRYGALQWVKIANYRWWPCEVIHERNIPRATKQMVHYPGQFVVRLYALEKYFWISRGRCFPFEEGDEKEKNVSKRKKRDENNGGEELEMLYQKGLEMAGQAYPMWKERMAELLVVGKRPDHYKHIKTNYPIGSVRINKPLTLSEIPSCDCDPRSNDPCGATSSCINRELKFECHPSVCRNGSQCRNQRFTLRQYPRQEFFLTERRGWGLRALEDIQKDQFVNEYVGDLIDEAEAERRLQWSHENNVTNYYMMILDSQRIIDAGPRGNYSRFMNHSCAPNLYAEKWTVNMDTRVGLFALRDIKAGEELTFNYNFMTKGQERMKCHCNAHNCSGFLGVPPSSNGDMPLKKGDSVTQPINLDSNGLVHKRGRGVRTSDTTAINGIDPEQECFRCGEAGPLIQCSLPECRRGYHLLCLEIERAPEGKWICPWHHCEECGRMSEVFCSECSTSYCFLHWDECVLVTSNGKLLCRSHDEMISYLMIKVRRVKNRDELDAILSIDTSENST